jgi:hypothetical protein
VFDDETAQNAFFDFWFNEYRVGGKSLAESADPVAAGLSPLEVEVLEAHRHSSTSFYRTEAVLPRDHQIRLRDLLEPDKPEVLLTDIGLSNSIRRGGHQLALFLRPLTMRGITMGSGFFFGFQAELVFGLLQAYRQKMKKVPPADLPEARFVFFFQKHRQMGVEQDFRDAV